MRHRGTQLGSTTLPATPAEKGADLRYSTTTFLALDIARFFQALAARSRIVTPGVIFCTL
jgi:hypothetical protein